MEVTQGNIQSLHVMYSSMLSKVMLSAPAGWQRFARRVVSTSRRNEYSWMRNIPQMRRAFGPLVFDDLVRKGYQVPNYRFQVGFKLDVDDIEDDNLAGLEIGIQSVMSEAASFTDRAVHTMLPLGLPGGAGLSFDGVPFFNGSHPKLDGTTYSNVNSGGGGQYWYLVDTNRGVEPVIWQDRRPLQMAVQNMPTDNSVFEDNEVRWALKARRGFGYTFPQLAYASNATLNEANLEAAEVAMMNQVGDDGRKLGIMPNLLIVGPSNKFAAKKLLERENNANGETNIHRGSLDMLVSHYVEAVTISDLVTAA